MSATIWVDTDREMTVELGGTVQLYQAFQEMALAAGPAFLDDYPDLFGVPSQTEDPEDCDPGWLRDAATQAKRFMDAHGSTLSPYAQMVLERIAGTPGLDVANTFCKTGPGGGVDPTCGSTKSTSPTMIHERVTEQVGFTDKQSRIFKKYNADLTGDTVVIPTSTSLKQYKVLKEIFPGKSLRTVKSMPPSGPTEGKGGAPESAKSTKRYKEAPQQDQYLTSVWMNDLSSKERSALREWTDGKSSKLRKQIARGETSAEINSLMSSLKKAPHYSGTVYRGMGGPRVDSLIEHLERAGVGGTWHDEAPHSMTRSPSVANEFSGGHLLVVVRTRTGRNIENASVLSEEAEVVGMPNTKYKIAKIERNVKLKYAGGSNRYKAVVHLDETN